MLLTIQRSALVLIVCGVSLGGADESKRDSDLASSAHMPCHLIVSCPTLSTARRGRGDRSLTRCPEHSTLVLRKWKSAAAETPPITSVPLLGGEKRRTSTLEPMRPMVSNSSLDFFLVATLLPDSTFADRLPPRWRLTRGHPTSKHRNR